VRPPRRGRGIKDVTLHQFPLGRGKTPKVARGGLSLAYACDVRRRRIVCTNY